MPVVGLRVHVAVADRRQRLDRKIKQAQREWQVGRDIGNRIVAEPEQEREDRVEDDEDQRCAAEESRPVHGHGAMVKIAPVSGAQPVCFDLTRANGNEMRPSPGPYRLSFYQCVTALSNGNGAISYAALTAAWFLSS